MKVQAEHYKGIEFIRISKLPEAQKILIAQSIPPENIIRIMKENELMSDCIQWKHYEAWFNENYKQKINGTQSETLATRRIDLAID